MSTSIKVMWGCECNPPYITGYLDADTDRVLCYRCDGEIANTESVTAEQVMKWNKEYEDKTGIKL